MGTPGLSLLWDLFTSEELEYDILRQTSYEEDRETVISFPILICSHFFSSAPCLQYRLGMCRTFALAFATMAQG